MSITVLQAKESLTGMLHGGTLNKVRNIEALFRRASNTMLTKIDPVSTMRTAPLDNLVHDDVYNYTLASDYKKIIDLYPQADRKSADSGSRRFAEKFDLTKGFANKTVSIESDNGTKVLRINWRKRGGTLLHNMNSLTANGTWAVVATATGLKIDSITKYSGSASIQFDVATTGDGIDNTTMSSIDLTDDDEVGHIFFWVYLGSDFANLTSITAIWGNDLTTNYWTGVAQTAQADSVAFKEGWNLIKVPWDTATETGTVAPATIDSFRVTFTVTSAMSNIRVDNIISSIGRAFESKYYSKYMLKNTSGTWIAQTTSDDDTIVLDEDATQIYLLECLKACAQQMENGVSDINYANAELEVLYRRYKAEWPSQAKKAVTQWAEMPLRRHRYYSHGRYL